MYFSIQMQKMFAWFKWSLGIRQGKQTRIVSLSSSGPVDQSWEVPGLSETLAGAFANYNLEFCCLNLNISVTTVFTFFVLMCLYCVFFFLKPFSYVLFPFKLTQWGPMAFCFRNTHQWQRSFTSIIFVTFHGYVFSRLGTKYAPNCLFL